MKRIVLTGATGFIGSHLVRALAERGEDVRVLTRSPRAGTNDIRYTPTERGDWYREVDGADVLIHLAGERVVGGRWTESMRKRILSSRIDSTRCLVEAMSEAKRKPSVFVCASAVGYYGPRPEEDPADESAPPGSDFLAEVCVAWEKAALEAATLGIRVVRARFGIVLGPDGGPLPAMVTPFRMFVGGPIGDGSQMVAWVHIDDAVGIVLDAIDDAGRSGAVNVVAPRSVSNAELSRAIGKALDKPSWVRMPAFVLKAALGDASSAILTGQAVVPRVMQDAGYVWRHPALEPALVELLARDRTRHE
jgi:uncharacterized protein (TIGR01777 family)